MSPHTIYLTFPDLVVADVRKDGGEILGIVDGAEGRPHAACTFRTPLPLVLPSLLAFRQGNKRRF